LTLIEVIEGGADTKALVVASKEQADAASNQSRSAQQFADTASLINGNINDAVGKLNLQAKETQALIEQAKRQSDLAERQFALLDRHG
jgi:hypothetical protein